MANGKGVYFFGGGQEMKSQVIDGLVEEGLLLRSKNGKLMMPKGYKKIANEIGHRNDSRNDSRNDVLNSRVRATYQVIKTNQGIQRKRISELLGKSISTVDRHIAILIKEDLIEHRDSDKTGGYYTK